MKPDTITFEELTERARDAVARSGLTHAQVAARIGRARPVVTRALSRPSTRDAETLVAIVEALTDLRLDGPYKIWRVTKP